jgi:hypothetical protein
VHSTEISFTVLKSILTTKHCYTHVQNFCIISSVMFSYSGTVSQHFHTAEVENFFAVNLSFCIGR